MKAHEIPMSKDYLEVTTIIGCPVNCIKYCPQELIVKKYAGVPRLSVDDFKKYIDSVPQDRLIWFCGFSEPLMNPDTITMMEIATNAGHKINLSTTLSGISVEDAERMVKLPFNLITLHLPDACGNAHIKMDERYFAVLKTVLLSIPNISFMSMNGTFETNHTEEIARGAAQQYHKGRISCKFLSAPNFQLMPNGDVYFCCMTRGLSGKIGSMKEKSYCDFVNMIPEISGRLAKNSDSVCHYCAWSTSYWRMEVPMKILRLTAKLWKRLGFV